MEVKKTPNRGGSADVQQSSDRSCTKEPPPAGKRQEETATPNSAYALNPPFRGNEYLSNKVLTDEDLSRMEKGIPAEENLKFVVVGDLNINSKYAKTFLAVTDGRIYGFDPTAPDGMKTYEFADVKRAYVKRYYGNAMMVFSKDDGGGEFVTCPRSGPISSVSLIRPHPSVTRRLPTSRMWLPARAWKKN